MFRAYVHDVQIQSSGEHRLTKFKTIAWSSGLLIAILAVTLFVALDWRSHSELNTIFKLRPVGYLLSLHKKDFGSYPHDLAEMVAKSRHERAYLFQPPILDSWKNEIVYDPSGNPEHGFLLYSKGKNGIDEKSLGDDVDFWKTLGDEAGYWTLQE